MSSLNKAMIIGRLGQDPEVRYTQSNTAVATLSIATSSAYKDKNGERQEETEWHKVVAWGRLAEIAQEYLRKGSLVYIEGPIKTRKWEDKNGVTRYSTEITALSLTMLGSKDSSNNDNSNNQSQRNTQPSAAVVDNFDQLDDDLPF